MKRRVLPLRRAAAALACLALSGCGSEPSTPTGQRTPDKTTGSGTTGDHDPGAAATANLKLDCGPRLDQVAEFEPRCQLIGAELPTFVCPQIRSAPGSLWITVLQPSAVTAGASASLGANSAVSIELAAATPELLVATVSPDGRGSLVFDQFSVGGVARGHFVGATVSVSPDPPFLCDLSSDPFVADYGPGLTHP